MDYIWNTNNIESNSTFVKDWKRVYLNSKMTDYLISNYGELMNMKTKRIRKWNISGDGYYKCTIQFEGHYFKVSAHRLVAIAFIPNPDNKPEVNHKDGDKSNNKVWNLEWVTSSENTKHAIALGLKWYVGMKGENNARHIYTEHQIHRACKMMENSMNRPIVISNITGIDRSTLYKIRKGEAWNHIACNYEFPICNFTIGEGNHNNKYTEEQIHQVCELIEESIENNSRMISNITGVSIDTIDKIRTGDMWRQISSYYEFPIVDRRYGEGHANNIYNNEQIHQVCQLLEDPYNSLQFISDYCKVGMYTVQKISKGKAWLHIAKDYKISPVRANRKSDRIIDLYKQSYSDHEIANRIMVEFALPDRKSTLASVRDIKKRYIQNLSGSSTIDQLQ